VIAEAGRADGIWVKSYDRVRLGALKERSSTAARSILFFCSWSRGAAFAARPRLLNFGPFGGRGDRLSASAARMWGVRGSGGASLGCGGGLGRLESEQISGEVGGMYEPRSQ